MVFIRMLKLFFARFCVCTILACCASNAVVYAGETIQPGSTASSGQMVLAGIDVLERDGFRQLSGRDIGLITNQTGINRSGAGDIQLLHAANGVNLVAIFNPEHGLFGKLDVSLIEDSRDPEGIFAGTE